MIGIASSVLAEAIAFLVLGLTIGLSLIALFYSIVTAVTAANIKRALTEMAKAYELYECHKFALEAYEYLKKKKYKDLKIIYFIPKKDPATGDNFLNENITPEPGFGIWGNVAKYSPWSVSLALNGCHYGVYHKGTVFDLNVPWGVPSKEWKTKYWVRVNGTHNIMNLQMADDAGYGELGTWDLDTFISFAFGKPS